MSTGMEMTAFVFPFTCTGISTSSSFIASSSWAGHSWWNTESVWPSASQSSSPICGANGARSRTTDSRVSLSMPPSFLAIVIRLLLHSMKPEITVFRLKPSRRVVIMWIILWRALIISLLAVTFLSLLSITRFQKRDRKRYTPSIPRSSHSASSSGGPTNNSYILSESQP